MIIETIAVSGAVLAVRKGRFSSLRRLRINGWYLLIFSAILQTLLSREILPANFHFATIMLTYILLIVCVLLNFRRLSMKITLVGIMLNFFVIAANNGYMPVSKKALEFAGYDVTTITSNVLDVFHSVINEATRLVFLADYLPIPEPYWFPQIWSIGDLFLIVGIFLFFQDLKPNYKAKN